jgi:hypothetical protein
VDNRPHHPLIRHARVTQLPPERLSCLDLMADPGEVREVLAKCADDWNPGDMGSQLPLQATRG